MANLNPNPSTKFKKGKKKTTHKDMTMAIARRRKNITWKMLKCVTLEDVAEFMTILMTLVKTPGRGQHKALEIFLKLVAILPKQEVEQVLSPTYTLIPNPVDIKKIQAEDDTVE